jgi:hypothetical protein
MLIMSTVTKIPEISFIKQIFIPLLLNSGMDKWRNREVTFILRR